MLPYLPAPPDRQTVRLRVMDAQVDLTRWTSYVFNQDILKPSDGWQLHVGDGDLELRQREALQVGARVRLYVEGAPLAEGFIDKVDIDAKRGSGTTYSISGRNRLGYAVDAVADPTLQFKDNASLLDILQAVYAPFGWVAEEHFDVNNDVNREAKKGIRGVPMTKGGKKKGPKPLKSFVEHQLKPKPHEGLHAFASRICERHGLRIWCSADGERLIVARPDFLQDPTHRIIRRRDFTNVLDGRVSWDSTDQPSVIIADGYSSSDEFGRGSLYTACVNPYFGVDKDGFVLPEVSALLSKYSHAKQLTMTTQPFVRRRLGAPMRPIFMHDEESKTQDQLDNFVRREMSLAMRKSVTASYTLEGHGQQNPDDGGYVPFGIDTVVEVDDEIAGLRERMYVQGVSYDRSRGGGTESTIELIRLHTLELGDAADEGTKKVNMGKNPFPDLTKINEALQKTSNALGARVGVSVDPAVASAVRKTTRALK